jgi:MoaA/NifB/PqqE/SkfB family radical SAM enzyme
MGSLFARGMAERGSTVNLRESCAALRLASRYVLGDRRPVLLGMVLTEACNLSCSYCRSHIDASVHFTYQQATCTLKEAYVRGHRTMYVTGGEPMLWRDGTYKLVDILAYARELGFFYFGVYTNGTAPLTISDCTYFITFDGPREVHEQSRTGTYNRILENVRAAESKKVFASMMISRLNCQSVGQYVREIAATRLFRGIWFNLFTGTREQRAVWGLSAEQRVAVLDTLWQHRQNGYPVMLSKSAYEAWRSDTWPRPLTQTEICTPAGFWPCCRDIGNPTVCEACGYGACVELSQLCAWKPTALVQTMRRV